jgi:hypothetical protein
LCKLVCSSSEGKEKKIKVDPILFSSDGFLFLVVEKTYEEYGNLNYYYFSRSVLVSKDRVFV